MWEARGLLTPTFSMKRTLYGYNWDSSSVGSISTSLYQPQPSDSPISLPCLLVASQLDVSLRSPVQCNMSQLTGSLITLTSAVAGPGHRLPSAGSSQSLYHAKAMHLHLFSQFLLQILNFRTVAASQFQFIFRAQAADV